MCGIFGFSGTGDSAETVIAGLKRLEYRGYDSWGLAVAQGSADLMIHKKIGAISDSADVNLAISVKEVSAALAHTRWATHGGVSEENGHPHMASDGRFALVQNGIVENYQALKAELSEDGYEFYTPTDTEVIVRLVERELSALEGGGENDLFIAVTKAFSQLEGRNTIGVLERESGELISIRNGSPLMAGRDEEGNLYIGSDILSIADRASEILELEDNEGVRISAGSNGESSEIEKFSLQVQEGDAEGDATVKILPAEFAPITDDFEKIDKGGFADFMIKEINEQDTGVIAATDYTEDQFAELVAAIKTADHTFLVGSGTASFAAAQTAYFLRELAKVPAYDIKAYEIDSFRNVISDRDLVIAISQSGETADTLDAVEAFTKVGAKVGSIVNMANSTLSRISDYSFMSRTGPEICVASTKAFSAQVSWGYLLAQTVAGNNESARTEVKSLAQAIRTLLDSEETTAKIKTLAAEMSGKEHAFVLGRGLNHQIALEGALKVKEITYKHFEGFPAGELKHGIIALIEDETPVFAVISRDENQANMLSAVAEVRARGAKVIAMSPEYNDLFDNWIEIPTTGGDSAEIPAELSTVLNIIPFQLLSYYLGKELGRDVDKPRNLAKSVTVR